MTQTTHDCTGCPVSAGTHKPADAVHTEIAEPGAGANAQTEIEAIEHDLHKSHQRATSGAWGKGDTTHETVSKLDGHKPYKVADFRHADDAHFCDLAHAHIPRLLAELSTLRARCAELQLELLKEAGRTAEHKLRAEQMSAQHETQAALNREARAKLAAGVPAAAPDARDGLYYLQDARWASMVGNCPSFWRPDGSGYTTNLDEAARFTFAEAMAQHRCRETDLPWLCSEVDKLRQATIDHQYMPRSWDEQRAAIAAQAGKGVQHG